MNTFEKLIYVGGPWLFGLVLILAGVYNFDSNSLADLSMILTGIIAMTLFCIAALLAKIVERLGEEN